MVLNAPGARRRDRSPRRLVAAMVAAGAVSIGAFVADRPIERRVDAAADELDAATLVQIRTDVRRANGTEVNVLMLDALGVDPASVGLPSVDEARGHRTRVNGDAVAELERLAGRSGVIGATAQTWLQSLELAATTSGDDDPSLLWGLADWGTGTEVLAALAESDVVRLDRVAGLDHVGALLLNDALDAFYVIERPTVDPVLVGYVALSEEYVRQSAGWLGPDPRRPFAESWVYDTEVMPADPFVASVERALVRSGLWESDAWILSWQTMDDPGPPPMALAEVAARARELDRATAATVDARLEAIVAEIAAEADSAHRDSLVATVGALGFGLIALVAAALLVRGYRNEQRQRYELLVTDHLTGVGNRHRLDEVTALRLADRRRSWHLVALVDMDRFKLVNDACGHLAGDAVLVETATRLQAVVDEFVGAGHGRDGEIVRFGGDEFLVALHATDPVDAAPLTAALQRVRAASVTTSGGVRLPLEFSLGIAVCDRPTSLDEMVRLADLALYDEKRARADDLGDRRADGFGPPPAPAVEAGVEIGVEVEPDSTSPR